MGAPELHDDLRPLAFLLGTWRGTGAGDYPTVEAFGYREEIVFEHVGEPYLLYRQASWDDATGEPVHFERGFLRPGAAPGAVEFVLAHPIGVAEVAHGRVDATSIDLEAPSDGVGRTATGLHVTGLRRRYRVDGDAMTYELDMATDETAMTLHLEGAVRRDA
jgi:nitrobindin-like protein